MERKYVCKNGVVERTRYLVPDRAQARGRKKKGHTSFRKQEANFNSAIRRAARILNCNYGHENGLLLTLDYSDEALDRLIRKLGAEDQNILGALRLPVGQVGTWQTTEKVKKQQIAEQTDRAMTALKDAAEYELTKYLRRIRRKTGAEIKFLSVTSDMDAATGEIVRVHHHVVLCVKTPSVTAAPFQLPQEGAKTISWDMLRDCWKHGDVNIRQLRRQRDYTPIASYLLRQVRHKPDAKAYRVSRGMELPEITEREVIGHVEIKAPAGAVVVERSAFNPETVTQYIRYIPKKVAYAVGNNPSVTADAAPAPLKVNCPAGAREGGLGRTQGSRGGRRKE